MRTLVSLLLVTVGLGLSSGPVEAQDAPPEDRARDHVNAGRSASALGDHETAAREFIAAFGITQDAALLQSIAAAYEALGQPNVAVVFLRRYLREASPLTLAERDAVRAKIKELDSPAPLEPAPISAPAEPREGTAEPVGSTPPVDGASAEAPSEESVAPPAASPESGDDPAPPTAGVVVEIHMTRALGLDGQGTAPGSQGGLFIGYMTSGVIFGLGLEFARVAEETTSVELEETTTLTTVLIKPGLRILLAHSPDRRVEAFAKVDLGIGESDLRRERNGESSDASNTRMLVQGGLGLRYWLHPQLAFGGSSGLRVDYARASGSEDGTNTTARAFAELASLFTAVELVGIF